ncbi:hypothetical protein Tco_0905569 [Tanacetum coccineum]
MNYMQQSMENPEDILYPTTVMNMALNVGNHNGLIVVPAVGNHNGNVIAVRAENNDEEFDLMVVAADYEEIEEVNANYILMANLQQTSTSGTHADKAPIYDSDGSAQLLESTTDTYLVQEDDNNVIRVDSNMNLNGGHKVNTVNPETREANEKLTDELAIYKSQEKRFESNQEKFEELENGYKKSVYQEQCLTKKINALHMSSSKTINTLNEKISNLNNQLSKEKSTVSYLQEEKEKLKSDFGTRENKLLDKLTESDKKIKLLDNILVKTGRKKKKEDKI